MFYCNAQICIYKTSLVPRMSLGTRLIQDMQIQLFEDTYISAELSDSPPEVLVDIISWNLL